MDLWEAVRGRRSVRRFGPEPVTEEDLLTLLDAARWAPSGGNMQLWRCLAIRTKSKLDEMARVIEERIEGLPELFEGRTEKAGETAAVLARQLRAYSLFFAAAPLVVAFLVRLNPYRGPHLQCMAADGATLYEANRDLGYVEIQSAAAAVQNLLLGAHSLGYGACWMNVPYIAKKDLKELLEVRPPWDLLAMVPIGRPAPGYAPARAPRREVQEIVTFV